MRNIKLYLICAGLLFFINGSCDSNSTQNTPLQNSDLYTMQLPNGFFGRAKKSEYRVYSALIEDKSREVMSILSLEKAANNNFGNIAKSIEANPFLGSKISLVGKIRTNEVLNNCGLWMRVDGGKTETEVLAFDNMQTRPIFGTTSWTAYRVVLNVPLDAKRIIYGALLSGKGQIWVDSLTLVKADESAEVTDILKYRR